MPETSARLVNIGGAAEYLATTERHMRDLVTQRRVPFHRIGRLIRFDLRELDEYVDACRVEAKFGPLAQSGRRG